MKTSYIPTAQKPKSKVSVARGGHREIAFGISKGRTGYKDIGGGTAGVKSN